MKILIVDDEIKIAQGIKRILLANLSFCVSVKCVSDAEEALETAEVFRPDLLITDIRMPRMNGLELIDKTKAEKWCTHFVILSGYENFKYAQIAIRKGVTDYLTKPVEKEYLCSICEKIYFELQKEIRKERKVKLPEFEFLKWNPYQADYPISLKNIISYIERNYAKADLSGVSISEELFFHPSYISQLISKYTDKSLNGIINYFRLKKALELLLAPQNYRISEVSDMVGFKGERQLYKSFQKYLFCTPNVFRNEYGENMQWNNAETIRKETCDE